MSDQNLMRVLRAVQALDVEDAPKQHRLRTPRCPPLPRFPVAVREGWQPEEREHVTGCAYCQKVTALEWRAECPGPFTLALYLESLCPDQVALDEHLGKDQCPRCQRLLRSFVLRAAAQPLRAGPAQREQVRRRLEGVAVGFAPLPEPGEVCDTAPVRRPYQVVAVRQDGSLTATLRETPEGNLALYVETPDPSLAGRQVTVEILGQGETLRVELTLEPWEGRGGDAQHTLGPWREFAPRLGADCALVVSLAADSPREEPNGLDRG